MFIYLLHSLLHDNEIVTHGYIWCKYDIRIARLYTYVVFNSALMNMEVCLERSFEPTIRLWPHFAAVNSNLANLKRKYGIYPPPFCG